MHFGFLKALLKIGVQTLGSNDSKRMELKNPLGKEEVKSCCLEALSPWRLGSKRITVYTRRMSYKKRWNI